MPQLRPFLAFSFYGTLNKHSTNWAYAPLKAVQSIKGVNDFHVTKLMHDQYVSSTI